MSFPLRDQRIETLLDVARMSNYEVDRAWLQTMGAYGKDGWQALYQAAFRDWLGSGKMYYRWLRPQPTEPELLKVMDAWADWRYGLAQVTNEKEAWRVFRRLCSSVDAMDDYASNSLAGHALGRLLPQLNPAQLVASAVQLVRTPKFRQLSFYSYHDWARGRIQYPRDRDDRKAFPSDYLVIDAIERLDRALDALDSDRPNIVERQVSKAILLWQGPASYTALSWAVGIGGPDLAAYLRKCWQASKRGDRRFQFGFSSSSLPDDVNLWLLLLAKLTGDEGRTFRLELSGEVAELIGQIGQHDFGDSLVWGTLDFIGHDISLGQRCAGAQYWPRYFASIKDSEEDYQNDKLRRLWSYLIRLEPVMPAEAYIQCWRQIEDRSGKFRYALRMLTVLPAERQRQVLEGLKQELDLRPENIKDRSALSSQNEVKWLHKELDRMISETDDRAFAQYIIKDLQAKNYRQSIQDWLLQVRPHLAVGELMAAYEDPKLRHIAVKLLANHPTPRRMALLSKLRRDPDEQIGAAAQEAVNALQRFRGHVDLLAFQTDTEAAFVPFEASEIVIRLYGDQASDPEFSTWTRPIGITRALQGLDPNGLLRFDTAEILKDSLSELDWPDRGLGVICGMDQRAPAVKDCIGNSIHVWPLGFRMPSLNRQSYLNEPLLCDAAGRPMPNASLTVELKENAKQRTMRISGFKSDSRGVLPMVQTQGPLRVSGLLFSHPDYGIALVDRAMLSRNRNLRLPLLKSGAAEYDRALFGKIVDGNGAAIEGAKVEVTGIQHNERAHVSPVYMHGKAVYTDARGRFNIYPSGQNIRSKIAPKAQYRLRIAAPKESQVPPYQGLHPNGRELDIKLEPNGSFHTISFMGVEGPLRDEGLLKNCRLLKMQPGPTPLELKWDYWKDGALLPEGQYRVHLRDRRFLPVEIRKDSPVNIVFHEEPERRFSGRVVHGITGAPLKGVFVIESDTIAWKQFSDLRPEEWDSLHALGPHTPKDHDMTRLISHIAPCESILRTDEDGRFSTTSKSDSFYQFTVFDQDFMPFGHRVNSGDIGELIDIDLGDIRLFPGARVKLGLDHADAPQVMPVPLIGAHAPAWAQAFQVFKGFNYDHWHGIREPRWIYVPAQVKFQLKLRPAGRTWSPLLIEEPIYLEPGQELDLGTVKLTRAIQVTIKVLDSDGKAVEGISLTRSQETDGVRFHIGYTDHEGRVTTHVYPNTRGQFEAHLQGKTLSRPFVFADQQAAGKEFVIILESEERR